MQEIHSVTTNNMNVSLVVYRACCRALSGHCDQIRLGSETTDVPVLYSYKYSIVRRYPMSNAGEPLPVHEM
jgi:hypothetical protein